MLPTLSKIFERILFAQMSALFDNVCSKYQCEFRKGYSTQHSILEMLGKWKKFVGKGKTFRVLLTDLPKAFIVSAINYSKRN